MPNRLNFEKVFERQRELFPEEYAGRSFTYGVMLYDIIKQGRFNDEQQDYVEDYIYNLYQPAIEAMRALGMRDTAYAVVDVLHADQLDEIARHLLGEEEC